MGENNWMKVRADLLQEMRNNPQLYITVMGAVEYQSMLHAVGYDGIGSATRDRWLQLPEMGHVIATAYNCVVHTLGLTMSLTFFPLLTAPVPINNRRVIILGHVGVHFVIPTLSPDCPLPPASSRWEECHLTVADGWPAAYEDRMRRFKAMVGHTMSTVEVHELS